MHIRNYIFKGIYYLSISLLWFIDILTQIKLSLSTDLHIMHDLQILFSWPD